jgi:Skp family chaperone for outer membrane proteins
MALGTDRATAGVQEDLQTDESERLHAFMRRQVAQLRAAVGEVARARGVSAVFDVSALTYAAVDLTDLVLQKLAKSGSKK